MNQFKNLSQVRVLMLLLISSFVACQASNKLDDKIEKTYILKSDFAKPTNDTLYTIKGSIKLQLQSNIATGYRWILDPNNDKHQFNVDSFTYESVQKNVEGDYVEGYDCYFIFVLKETELLFNYVQPWDPNVEDALKKNVRIEFKN